MAADLTETLQGIRATAQYCLGLELSLITDPLEQAKILTIIRSSIEDIGSKVKAAKEAEKELSNALATIFNDQINNKNRKLDEFGAEMPKSTSSEDHAGTSLVPR